MGRENRGKRGNSREMCTFAVEKIEAMPIRTARFVCSSEKYTQCPRTELPEVAFIGRSNVGKSSLINMLTNHKSLAKVSGTPGKTQLINHFLIDESWYLVDLPGYGYAQTSKTQRKAFDRMIRDYILERENLYSLFQLVDVRHSPQKNDVEFLQWLGANGVPVSLIMTKADKLTRTALAANVEAYRTALLETWEEPPPMLVTSATSALGKEEVISYIQSFITPTSPAR